MVSQKGKTEPPKNVIPENLGTCNSEKSGWLHIAFFGKTDKSYSQVLQQLIDPSVGAKILKLLLNLQDHRGLSMLYITHDIALTRKVSDRMDIMLNGRIIEEKPANDLVAKPDQPYTRLLEKAASRI